MPNYEDFKRYGELSKQGQEAQPTAAEGEREPWLTRLLGRKKGGKDKGK